MKASRADYSRRIDWSAVKGDAPAQMRRQVLRFVAGVRGERKSEVTSKQILAWFKGTPAPFVDAAIGDAVIEGELRPCSTALVRRHNARTVYELTDAGRAAISGGSNPFAKIAARIDDVANDLCINECTMRQPDELRALADELRAIGGAP